MDSTIEHLADVTFSGTVAGGLIPAEPLVEALR